MSDVVHDAKAYAARGWPVLPLHSIRNGRCTCGRDPCPDKPGKHPRTEHGVNDATIDAAQIEKWWTTWPSANVAIRATGFVAIDVDPRNGGDKTIAELLRSHGNLPPTVEAATGGGGQHLLYQRNGKRPVGKLGPGIEVKSDGGYIVVAPSIHQSGQRYRWISGRAPGEIEIAELPERWRSLLYGDATETAPNTPRPDWNVDDEPAPLRLVEQCLGSLKPERADEYDSWITVGLILYRTQTDPAADTFAL